MKSWETLVGKREKRRKERSKVSQNKTLSVEQHVWFWLCMHLESSGILSIVLPIVSWVQPVPISESPLYTDSYTREAGLPQFSLMSVLMEDSSQIAVFRGLLSASLLKDQGEIQSLWSEIERLKAISRASHWRRRWVLTFPSSSITADHSWTRSSLFPHVVG